jgi:molybdate transport system ATP-binding protein
MLAGRWQDGAVQGEGAVVHGLTTDPAPDEGDDVVAVFRPSAVSVFREAPGGSPRNSLPVTVTDLEPHGDQVRVRAGDLAAEVTVLAAAELDLTPGVRVTFSVKASEVAVYRT